MEVKEASVVDIQVLAVHHRKMFEEIWEKKGQVLDETDAENIEQSYIHKLENQLNHGMCKAWVVQNGNEIIASGAITIISYIPIPNDPNLDIAYLHSIYTEKEFRNQKYAQSIIDEAVNYCKKLGIKRMILNASDSGKPIYEKYGFVSAPDTMRLFL